MPPSGARPTKDSLSARNQRQAGFLSTMTNRHPTMNTPINDSTPTSLASCSARPINGTQVRAIEIPLFQRDYAQGRNSDQARHVRERFIADLCSALDRDKELHLDFLFGDVVNGTAIPFGRSATTDHCFLLHCYLCWQLTPTPDAPHSWHALHYATRPGARAFCQFLTRCRPDMGEPQLSKWLRSSRLPAYLETRSHHSGNAGGT